MVADGYIRTNRVKGKGKGKGKVKRENVKINVQRKDVEDVVN